MAETVEGQGGAKKTAPAKKGHNRVDLRKKLEPFMKEICGDYDKMEEVHGSHVMKINRKFENISEATGFPKAMIRSEVARVRRRIKEEAKEKELEEEEREEIEAFRDAFKGTPFGKYAEGELAKP